MMTNIFYRLFGWVVPCKKLLDMTYGQRPITKYLKNNYCNTICYSDNVPLVGVEIGVWKGLNALNMLRVLDIEMLYLIDPYTAYIQDNELMDYSYGLIEAKKNLLPYDHKIKFIRKNSFTARHFIPDMLDFVYIDGNHSYRNVKEDIELYYPKIRIGGILGGHDFGFGCEGLMKAVIEFVEDYDLKLIGSLTDWWVIKE